MKKLLTLLLLLSCFQTAFTQHLKPEATKYHNNFVLGTIDTLRSTVLNETRTLNIFLPEGYNPAGMETYPVIYLLDGSANEDFIHICGVVQFFNLQFNMPKTIVVGIANVDRKRDFTFPTTVAQDKKDFPTTGGSEKFITFIEKELQPYINQRYKTNQERSIIGQSLGGLLASEILLKKPGLFNHFYIVSPSFWWDKESLLNQFAAAKQIGPAGKSSIYIAVGNEGKVMVKDAKTLSKLLKKQANPNQKLEFQYFPKEDHGSILHQAIYKALELEYRKK
jgi:predicted alpha/beta superfamily hydrolase